MDRIHAFRIAAAGLAVTALGSLAPWATMLGITVNGPDVDGLYTLGFAGAAALALWRAWHDTSKGMLLACAALAGIALAIGGYDFQRISRGPSEGELGGGDDLASALAEGIASTMSVGWGLYLVVLGALATTAGALAAWRLEAPKQQQPKESVADE